MLELHLIPNSHLDPVWLWTRSEGTAEIIATVRSVLRLMGEFPELTYIRGEAWSYQVLERHAPEMLDAIAALVEAGRWDIVGGNYIQPDTNLPHTAALLRQFSVGQAYFQKRFGRRATVAWAADSFGHSAGWPEIFAASGLARFAFSRPGANILPLPGDEAGFYWEGRSGERVLCHRLPVDWYGNERHDLPARLDRAVEMAARHGWRHVPVYFGLGNHGGGPTRRHLRDILAWREAHPEVSVIFSTLSRFFSTWEKSIADRTAAAPPVFRVELNFCLRGCYSSGARIKHAYRGAENALLKTERIAAALDAAKQQEVLAELWRGLLFNAFHDILPGSAIEEALDQQKRELDGIRDRAENLIGEELIRLGQSIDTSCPETGDDDPLPVPHVVFNPSPTPRQAWIEIEPNLDYRPLSQWAGSPEDVPLQVRDGEGKALAFQRLEPSHNFMLHLAWRVRLFVKVRLPSLGWTIVRIGLGDRRNPPPKSPARFESGICRFGRLCVEARKGSDSVRLEGPWPQPLLLGIACLDDPWGAWGDHYNEKEAWQLKKILGRWFIKDVRLVETGPHRVAVWTKWRGIGGSLDLLIRWTKDARLAEVQGRLLFDHRHGRVKLLVGGADQAEFEVPGARVVRGEVGEVPGGTMGSRFPGGPPLLSAGDRLLLWFRSGQGISGRHSRPGLPICGGSAGHMPRCSLASSHRSRRIPILLQSGRPTGRRRRSGRGFGDAAIDPDDGFPRRHSTPRIFCGRVEGRKYAAPKFEEERKRPWRGCRCATFLRPTSFGRVPLASSLARFERAPGRPDRDAGNQSPATAKII